MAAGALGVSLALIYPPESFQTTEDLVQVVGASSSCNGIYATHMRDESGKLLDAIREAIEIGEKGHVKVEIFHFKAAFAPEWGKLMPQAIQLIQDRARPRRRRGRRHVSLYRAGHGPQHHRSQLGI